MGKKIGCLAFVFVVLAALVGGGIYLSSQIPSIDALLPPNLTTMAVTVSAPANGDGVPLNVFTTIEASAFSAKPIVAFDLWIDGTPSTSKVPTPNGNEFSAFWTWTPASEGEHILLVRARDGQGRIAISNVVRVNAGKESNAYAEQAYTPKPGETAKSVADKFKIPAQEIIDLNPQVSSDPNAALPPNQPIEVPVPIPPQPQGEDSTAPDGSTPQSPPGNPGTGQPQPPPPADPGLNPDPNNSQPPLKFNPPLGLGYINFCAQIPALCGSPTPPAAPKILGVAGQNCDATLYIKDNSSSESGFFVYRLGPGEVAFKRIATLDASSGGTLKFADADLFGSFLYYAAAFNSAGESPSVHIKVKQDKPTCLTPEWMSLQLDGAKAKVSQPVDKLYCYLSVNGGKAQRIPTLGYLFPKNGEFDLSQVINTLASPPPKFDLAIVLDCWGWQGSTLLHFGTAKETIKAGATNPNLTLKMGNMQFFANLAVGAKFPPSNPQGGNPLPPPPPPPGGSNPNPTKIAPPFNLRATTDVNECIAHLPSGLPKVFLAPVCDAAIKNGDVVLVWEWNLTGNSFPCNQPDPGCPNYVADIDGYNIFRFSKDNLGKYWGGELIRTVTPKELKTQGFPFSLGEGDTTYCYTIYSFKGTQSSSSHDNFCPGKPKIPVTPAAPAITAMETVKLPPSKKGTTYKANADNCIPVEHLFADGHLTVGHDKSATCAAVMRGLVRFDLDFLAGKQIASAKLKFNLIKSEQGNQSVGYSSGYCAKILWLSESDWNPINFVVSDWISQGKGYAMLKPLFPGEGQTVTVAVKEWTSGKRPNFGFILRGFEESLSLDPNESACWTYYGDFELEVTYIP